MEQNGRNNRKNQLSQNKKQKGKVVHITKLGDTNKKGAKKIATMSQRLRLMLLVFFMILLVLIGRLGWLQIVQGADLKEAMYNQLITSRVISPKRGTIYDSTGKALARSAQVDTVSINSTKIVVKSSDEEVAAVRRWQKLFLIFLIWIMKKH